MARKSWSNVMVLLAAANLALAIAPANPLRPFHWMAFPLFVGCAAYLRRRMI